MEFTDIAYAKTVEGNYEVTLIFNHVVVAKITFPSEELAAEYVDTKKKLKALSDSLLQQVQNNLNKVSSEVETVVGKAKAAAEKLGSKVLDTVESGVEEAEAFVAKAANIVEEEVETVVSSVKAKVSKQKGIDVSAHVAPSTTIDTSAKVGTSHIIDTSAKAVFPE